MKTARTDVQPAGADEGRGEGAMGGKCTQVAKWVWVGRDRALGPLQKAWSGRSSRANQPGDAVSPHKSASPKDRLVGPLPLNSGKPGAMVQSRQAELGISVLGAIARPIKHRFNQAIAVLGLRLVVYFLLERAAASAPGANSLVLSTAIARIAPFLGP